MKKLEGAIETLEALPLRHQVHNPNADPDKAVRVLVVGAYLIHYRVEEDTKTVFIITVRHGKRKRLQRFPR